LTAEEKEREHFELASTNWKRSDARDVTKWFEEQNALKSPPEKIGRQMRRICRLVKKFARSRNSWKKKTVGGFIITKLVEECYHPFASREDYAFYRTLTNIYDRLLSNQVVSHPVTQNEIITKDYDDPKIIFFRDNISGTIARLNNLFLPDCTEKKAANIWNLVFNSKYF